MSSPLFTAAKGGFAGTVRKLIENGIDVNIVDEYGCTPLLLAARQGHSEVVRILLEHKGTVHNIRNREGESPIDVAVSCGHAEVLRVLLVNDTVMAEAVENKTRLVYIAAQRDRVEALNILMDQLNVEVNAQDGQGRSLLAVSAYEGSIGVVQLLLENLNIDVNLRDTVSRCPLSHAICSRWYPSQIVQAIISHSDIDINSKDDQGYTPLSLAIDSGRWAVVELILAHTKTKIDTEDDSEQTISLGTLLKIVTPRPTSLTEEERAQYVNEAFQYFVEKRNFLVDWMQEDASATLLNFIEDESSVDAHLETILQRFPLDLPGHDRLLDSLVAMLLRRGSASAIEIIFKYSTLVPNLSSDQWLSRIEAGFQQTDAYHLNGYCQALSILVDKDTGFPSLKNERMNNVSGNMLLRAASSVFGDWIFESLSQRENVDFNYRDHNNCTALWYAADNAKFDNMKQLLNIDDIEVHHKDNTDHETAVLRLLKVVEDLTRSNDKYDVVAYRDRLTRAKDLIELLLQRNTIPENGTMLIQAATLGQQDAVRFLLGCENIDLNQRGDNDETPLIRASNNGHKEVVEMLLSDSRVIPTLEDKFQHSALYAATLSDHLIVASLLLERDNITWTRFCNDRYIKGLEFLSRAGLPLNARDPRGRTPLHLACLNNDVRMVQELVIAGLDVNLEDNHGETPLRLATHNQHIDLVNALLGGSANMKGATKADWLTLTSKGGRATVLEISKDSLGKSALHFKDITNTLPLWNTTTDTCCLTSFHDQDIFMSKLSPTLKDDLTKKPRGAIVTSIVQNEVVHFGASLEVPSTTNPSTIVPSTLDEPDSSNKLMLFWHNKRVAWKMHNITSEVLSGQPAWKTMGYASSLPYGWIPDSASDFLALFILDAEQAWLLYLDHADEYLADQRSRQIDGKGEIDAFINVLAEDAQLWAQLRSGHKFQVECFKREYITFCRNYRQGNDMAATMPVIDDFSNKIADRLLKLDQTTRDLLQLFIFLPMTFASSLFGMNVDILEGNPNWRWFLLFAGGALVITFVVWLISKYSNMETLLERHLGKRLQRLSDPTARKPASSHSL